MVVAFVVVVVALVENYSHDFVFGIHDSSTSDSTSTSRSSSKF